MRSHVENRNRDCGATLLTKWKDVATSGNVADGQSSTRTRNVSSPSDRAIDAVLWRWDACRPDDLRISKPGRDQEEVAAAALSLEGEQADMIYEAVRRDACLTGDEEEVRKAT